MFQHLELWDEGKSDGKAEIAARLFCVDTKVLENKQAQRTAKGVSPEPQLWVGLSRVGKLAKVPGEQRPKAHTCLATGGETLWRNI